MTVTLRLWHVVLLVAAVALAVGIAAGLLLARGSEPTVVVEPSADDVGAKIVAGLVDENSLRAARAYVRSSIPATEAYYADHGSYEGLTVMKLLRIDGGIENIQLGTVTAESYCIESTVNEATASFSGPAGVVVDTACS